MWVFPVKSIVSPVSAAERNHDLEHDQPDDGRVGFLLFKPEPLAKIPVEKEQFSVQTWRQQQDDQRFFGIPQPTHDVDFERLDRRG